MDCPQTPAPLTALTVAIALQVTGLMANEYVGNGTDIVDTRLNK
jgi:hypothetical protein